MRPEWRWASIRPKTIEMMEKVFFSLGSNIGDRESNLRMALEKMNEAFGRRFEAVSSFIETESWGFIGDNFINCAVMYMLEEEPEVVLARCKAIERGMGRNEVREYDADGRRVYHSRIIDIDILLFGDRNIRTDNLTVPHPLMGERDFVRRTLQEIL